jgi:hypothetical protein
MSLERTSRSAERSGGAAGRRRYRCTFGDVKARDDAWTFSLEAIAANLHPWT